MTALSLDMDSNDLHDWIASNGAVHVVFNTNASNMECYPEEGIQTIITMVKINDKDDVHKWIVDYTQFEVLNSLRESSNYYGSSPTVSAKEKRLGYLSAYATCFYKNKDTLYVESNDKLSRFLQSIQPIGAIQATPDDVEQRFAAVKKEFGGFSI